MTVLADAVTATRAVSSGAFLQVQLSPDKVGAVKPSQKVSSQVADTVFFACNRQGHSSLGYSVQCTLL